MFRELWQRWESRHRFLDVFTASAVTRRTSVDNFTNFRTSLRLEASQTVSVGTSHGKAQPAGCVGSKDRKLRSRSLQAEHVIESRAKLKLHFCCYSYTLHHCC